MVSVIGRGIFGVFGEDILAFKERINTAIDSPDQYTKVLKECSGLNREADISQIMGDKKYNRISSTSKYAIKTAGEALNEASRIENLCSSDIGIFMSTTEGPVHSLNKFYKLLKISGFKKGNPLLFPETSLNIPSSYVSIAYKITGPVITLLSGLTSGHEVIEVADNFLTYGAIKYALIISAEEPSDFVLWRKNNANIVNNNVFNEQSPLSEIDETLVLPGANSLVLKKEKCHRHNGIIHSVSIVRDDNLGKSIELGITEALDKAKLKIDKIDIIVNQNNGNKLLNGIEDRSLQNVVNGNIPIINFHTLFGDQHRKCTLLNINLCTIFQNNKEKLTKYITNELNKKNKGDFNKKINTIMLISLSQTGQCGVLIFGLK